jgi:AbiJ N-terminal domain 3/Abortive infection C-terminus
MSSMKKFADNPEDYLPTIIDMLVATGASDAAELLERAEHRVRETETEGWNSDGALWTLSLGVPATEFARLGEDGRRERSQQITQRIYDVLKQFTNDSYNVEIVPKIVAPTRESTSSSDVSRATRRNIIDGLKLEGLHWAGELDDVEFLGRIFDLKSLPSTDSRYPDATSDIWQHRINNDDWPSDWIFGDSRFKILTGSTEDFLAFLCEMVHPVVRPDRVIAQSMVSHFNEQLRKDGWRLREVEKIAGRPRYICERIRNSAPNVVARAQTAADSLDAAHMHKEIERVEKIIDTDPALAIGTAKELVESCCKSILTKRGIPFTRGADLPELTKLLAKELKLVPDGITEAAKGADNVKRILQNLSSITHNLAELRGLYGTGHGRDGSHRGLSVRHARLAVGTAVTFIDFVTATHHHHNSEAGKPSSNKKSN